jgi:Domain of unknown function (DUF3883)
MLKRLIEVALPLKEVSEQSAREKSIRVRHISIFVDRQADRCIVVKGRPGMGGVALTRDEWIKAQRFCSEYRIYSVVNCNAEPELALIEFSTTGLRPTRNLTVVRYLVTRENWRRAALM